MDTETGASQTEASDEVVAVLPLVVQHCPACSKDPQGLCSLLQVSTTCKSALQHVKGHCSISITVDADNAQLLKSCATWLSAHMTLVEELRVVWPQTWQWGANAGNTTVSTADDALAAAIRQLSTLKALTLTTSDPGNKAVPMAEGVEGGSVLPDSMIYSLSALTQVTRLQLSNMDVGSISSLPSSVQHLVLVVDVSSVEGQGSSCREGLEGPPPLACLDFGHLPVLSHLDVTAVLPAPAEDERGFNLFADDEPCTKAAAVGAAGVSVRVPSVLTGLRVSGPITELCCAEGPEFPELLQFEASVTNRQASMPVSKVVALVGSAPKLTRLQLERYMRLPFGYCVEPMRVEDAALLAAAVGSAAQLTSLRIAGCTAGAGFAAQILAADSPGCVQWGQHMAQLIELRELDMGEIVLQTADVLTLSCLTELTALRIEKCSPGVQANAVQVVCHELTQLQELYFGKSANLSITGPGGEIVSLSGTSTEMFPAVAYATALRVLSLGGIYGMACIEADLQLLKPLVYLTELVLSPKAEGFAEEALASFVADMPALECIRTGNNVLTRASLLA